MATSPGFRMVSSMTNVNMASATCEAQPGIDLASSNVLESSSSQYLTGGSLSIPLMMWSSTPPSHHITQVCCMPDARTIVTGSETGQLVVWTGDEDTQTLTPRNMLFGHSERIECLCATGTLPSTTRFVSSDKCGRMCLWESGDGRCLESIDDRYMHTSIRAYATTNDSGDVRLLCIGHYPEVLVMDAKDLYVLHTLQSRVEQDWMSSMCLLTTSAKANMCMAISHAGMVKLWTLNEDKLATHGSITYEDESKQMSCANVRTIEACRLNPRSMLVVTPKAAKIFDASDMCELLSMATPITGELLFGTFIGIDKVALAVDDGTVRLYQLPVHMLRGKAIKALGESATKVITGDEPLCYCIMQPTVTHSSTKRTCSGTPPSFHASSTQIVSGDENGTVNVWRLPQLTDNTIHTLQQQAMSSTPVMPSTRSGNVADRWDDGAACDILRHIPEWRSPTSTLYVPTTGRLFLGRADGTIAMLCASHAIARQMFDIRSMRRHADWPKCTHLVAHTASVTCLLYPRAHSDRYDVAHLVSGAVDFSVVLWDLNSCTPMHTFTVQAGPIEQLFVPPPHCSPRISFCVASVAADHSVALLSLKEHKCVLLASRHIFPIEQIVWRPADDFLLVLTTDHSLYVWQMESASLDRVVTGLLVDDIIASSRDLTAQWLEDMANTTGDGGDSEAHASAGVQMIRAMKNRNVQAMRKIAVDAVGGNRDDAPEECDELRPPMLVQALGSKRGEPQSHLLVFNIESLVYGLLVDEHSLDEASTVGQSASSTRTTHVGGVTGLLSAVKNKADQVLSQKSPTTAHNAKEASRKSSNVAHDTLCLDIAQLVLSALHAWTADADLDNVCEKKLGLLRPKAPLCFGIISRHGHMSVQLPAAVTHVARVIEHATNGVADEAFRRYATRTHWHTSSTMTTQHLEGVVALANTMMSVSAAAFLPEHSDKRRLLRRMSSSQSTQHLAMANGSGPANGRASAASTTTPMSQSTVDQLAAESSQLKQGWSLVAALHCVLLPDLVVDVEHYRAPRIELLARRWQDRCIELREAAQALLLRELNRVGGTARQTLLEYWAQFLPSLQHADLNLFGPDACLAGSILTSMPSSDLDTARNGPTATATATPLITTGLVHGQTGIHELRRRQATAIVLLAVMGAEFGDDVQNEASKSQKLSHEDVTRRTANALSELLLHPPTALLPSYSPLRRAGIDLLGRGFCVWQPYLDINKILVALLELCANAEKTVPGDQAWLAWWSHQQSFSLRRHSLINCLTDLYTMTPPSTPLSAHGDTCRAADGALTMIASARPAAFVTTLAMLVHRYNTAADKQTLQHTVASPILKARAEIVKLIQVLAEKQAFELATLMVPLADVIVHCLDTQLLKAKCITEVLPCLAKFQMLAYNGTAKRLVVGGKNGAIVMHELRASKSHTINAHSQPITAVAMSDDGKYLATYSADEAKLHFYQTASSFMGMGASQIKLVKQVPAPAAFPVSTPQGSPTTFKAKLVWTGGKAVNLLLPNNTEIRFNV